MRNILDKNMNDGKLYKLFGEYSRYVFGVYVITFNNKDLSSDNPSDLFKKVKDEYIPTPKGINFNSEWLDKFRDMIDKLGDV